MRVLHWGRGDLDVADGDGEAARLRRGQDELTVVNSSTSAERVSASVMSAPFGADIDTRTE